MQGGHRGRAVGEPDHVERHRPAARLVAVERGGVRAGGQHVGERAAQVDGVLDAGVHALAAGGAVHVGGVAGQEDRPRR